MNLGGAAQAVNWGVGGFMTGSTSSALIFSSGTALAEVEWVNPINLGSGYANTRTIQVDDNTTTTTDFATVSGIVTGSAGTGIAALTKTGAGALILTGNNTFTGGGNATAGTGGVLVNNGTLVTNSFAGGGPLGALNGPGDVANRLVIGAAANSPNLVYVGAGETVTRRIELAGTGGTSTIENDGSGPLLITDVVSTATGTKTLQLRGINVDRNEVSAVLANNGTIALALTKSDSGTWILSGANTYSGATTINGGVLVLTNDSALGTSAVTSNANAIQATGGTRTLANNFTISLANTEFSGANSFVLNGTLSNTAGTSGVVNFLPTTGVFNPFTGGANPVQDAAYAAAGGKTLTINGTISLQETTNNRTLQFRGSGATVLNGLIRNGGTANGTLQVDMATNTTLGTGPGITILSASSTANTFTGNVQVTSGVLQLNTPAGSYSGASGPIGTGNNLQFTGGGYFQTLNSLTFSQGVVVSGTGGIIQGDTDLRFNGTTLHTGGSFTLNNNLNAGRTLTLGGLLTLAEVNQTRVFTLAGTGSTIVVGAVEDGVGSGGDSLIKTGTGSLTLQGVNTFSGNLTVSAGILTAAFDTAANNQLGNAGTAGTGTLTLGQGTLVMNKTDATTGTQTYAGTTLSANTSSVLTLNVSNAAGSLTLNTGTSTAAATITRGAQATLHLNLQGSGTGVLNVGNVLTVGNWLTLTNSTGTFFTTKDASNNVIPAVTATKNDVTTWLVGDNVSDDAAGYTGTVSGIGLPGVNSVRFNGAVASTVAIGAGQYLNVTGAPTFGGGILVTPAVGAFNSAISGGVLTSSGGELIVAQSNPQAGNSLTISSRIENSLVAVGVTKAGPGTLDLSGVGNSYTGTTSINEGRVRVSGGSAIGDRSTVLIANNPSAIFDLNGSNEAIGSLSGGGLIGSTVIGGISTSSTVTTGGTVAIGAGNLTINQTASTTYSGLITGTGSLTVTGSAVANALTLNTASNPFSGALTVSGAQLVLANGALSSGLTSSNLPNVISVTIRNGGGLNLSASGALNANRLNDAAPITLSNTGPSATVPTVGLNFTSDQVSTVLPRFENVGAVTLAGGANTIRVDATAIGVVGQLTLASLARTNASTLVVLGTGMEDSVAARRGDLVVTADANLIAGLVGGGSTVVGAPNISILPWAAGSNAGGAATATGSLGNSFVTYNTTPGFGNGFRALSTSEYEQLLAGGGTTAQNNVRYAGATSLTLTGTGHSANALLVENTATLASGSITVSGAGAGDSLALASGAALFTGTQPITITGFNGGITTGTGEYLFTQNNSSGNGVTIASNLTSTAGLTKAGPGLLRLTGTNTGLTGTITVNQGTLGINGPAAINGQTVNLNGGALGLAADGNGFGTRENIVFAPVAVNLLADSALTVDRLASNSPLVLAANKTVQAAVTINGLTNQILTINNNNGFGLELTGAMALSAVAAPTFNVATASESTRVQGLTLSGVLSGGQTGAGNVVFTKSGLGALVLGNAANSFGGGGSVIDVQNGVLSIASLAALGNPGNIIQLNPSGAVTATLRLTEDLTLGTNLRFGALSSTDQRRIEVVGGKTVTLGGAFDLTLAPNAPFAKADAGLLILGAANPNYGGVITVAQGALRVTNAGALGTSTPGSGTTVSAAGAALLVPAGMSLTEPLTLAGTGISSGGALRGEGAGATTFSGLLTLTAAASLGADSGHTLNITGGLVGAQALTFAGEGNINVSTTAIDATTPVASITKIGTGTTTLGVASPAFVGNLTVNAGRFVIGAGGAGAIGGTGTITGQPGATLAVDDTGTAAANRLGGRAITLAGAAFEYNVNGSLGSTESTGTITFSSGASTLNVINSGGLSSTITFGATAAPTFNAGSTIDVLGTAFGTATNKILFGAAPTLTPATTGLLPRITVGGSEFATYGANGLVAFTGYSPVTDISSASATETFLATAATLNEIPTSQTINALTLSGGGATVVDVVSGLTPTTLTLTSGAVLTRGGDSTLSVPVVALGAEGIFHIAGTSQLTVTSSLSGTAGLTKSQTGTLLFNNPQYYTGTTTINAGTVRYSSGVTNTQLFNTALTVNGGATLDLRGGAQYVAALASQGAAAGSTVVGGTITSATAATLVTSGGASVFGGQINGPIFFNKSNTAGTLTLTGANNSTGSTLITGGGLTLADSAALPNTPDIAIQYGTLTLSNTNLVDNPNRVNDAAPITLRGGSIVFNGRAQTASSETLGALTLAQGISNVTAAAGGTGVNSAELTFASLTRAGTSTLNIQTANGQLGSAGRIIFTAAPALTNNLVGPWAVSGGVDFLTYVPTLGLALLGAPGAAAYDGTALPAGAGAATQNIKLSAGDFTIPDVNPGVAGTFALNALAFAATANGNDLTFADGADTLNLSAGGMLKSGNFTGNIGATPGSGNLTAGGATATGSGVADFYFHLNSNAVTTVNASIVNNAASGDAVRFVPALYNAATLSLASSTNSYTGGTVVTGGAFTGTLNIAATGNLPAGGLTISGATVSQTVGGVIAPQAVTLNGAGVLTLANQANTLASLTFNNNGGAAPTVTPTGTLTLTGPITSSSGNVGSVATIGAGNLNLNANNSFAVVVNPTLVNGGDVAPWQSGLTINAVVENGGITKTGAGVLQLGGQSTFAGGVNLQSGGLIIAASSSPALGGPITSGPLGTGSLTVAANTSLLAGAAAQAVANPVSFLGDVTFNGTNNLTFNGAATIPAIWNVVVTAPQMTVSLANVTGSNATDVVTKAGLGVLQLGNFAGTLQSSGGLVLLGDGNGLGTFEQISLGGALNLSAGATSLTVNHSAAAVNAFNKTLQKSDLSLGTNDFVVTNSSGYGVGFTGTTTFNGAPNISVQTATASNVVQGLTFSGPVTDGATSVGLIKAGNGALVLTNAANDFGGAGLTIDIRKGIVAVPNDGALGDPANTVTLNVNATTGAGFRATDTFTSARTFVLNQPANPVEVTVGKILTLSAPFSLGAVANALTKNDNGVLEITADNSSSGWTGGLIVNAGAVRLSSNNAAGSSTTPISVGPVGATTGAALQLANGVTVSNPVSVQAAGNAVFGGINFGGQIESVSGTNTYAGLITVGFDSAIGANAGSTLNITGGINGNAATNHQLVFTGAGDLNISGTPLTATGGVATGFFAVQKFGSGKLTVSNANAVPISDVTGFRVNAGTVLFNGGGMWTGPFTSTATNFVVNAGGTLTLDNSTAGGSGNVNNRLGTTRLLQLIGGNFNLIGSESSTTTETFASPTFSRGFTTITVTAPDPGFGTDLVFTGASNNPATAQNSTTAPSGTSVLFRGSGVGSAPGGGVGTITSTGGFTFAGQTGATNTATKGILPWALVDNTTTGTGISFATTDATGATGTSRIRPLAAGEFAAANTIVANNNINLTGAPTTQATTINVNSLTFSGNASLTLGAFAGLTASSGGILAQAGFSSIGGGVLNAPAAGTPLNVWTLGELTISSVINGGNGTANGNIGFVKAGAGTLTLAPDRSTIPGLTAIGLNSMSGQLVINQGTIKLAGGTNTVQPGNFLSLGIGGTLDLNGNSQFVGALFTDGGVTGAGGTVMNSGQAATFVHNADNAARNFAGTITGNIFYNRTGQNAVSYYSPQTYTDGTLINGGTNTILRDQGALVNTSSIDLRFATLTADNNVGTNDLPNGRINDAAPIAMRGATLAVTGRAQTASVETIGAVTIEAGSNTINPNVGATGVNSVEITGSTLARTSGSAATLQVGGTNLGTIGSSSRYVLTTAPTLTNNIVGGWAEAANDFLTYIPGLGFAALNQAGAPGYDVTNTFAGATGTKNVRLTATTSVGAGGAVVNALAMTGATNITFAVPTDTLNIVSGGLIGPNAAQSIGATADSGRLTAGGVGAAGLQDLYVFNRSANALTINSRIVDNTAGTAPLRLVATAGTGTNAITLTNSANSYTGGTVLNGGTLNLSAATGTPIPAATTPADGLVIQGGTVTMNTRAGQIAPTNVVTLTGPSALNLFGNNTLGGLVFDNQGGAATPTVTTFSTVATAGAGATGVLTLGASGLSATSANVGTTGLVSGRVDFGAAPSPVMVAPIIVNGVEVAPRQATVALQAVINSAGGLVKQGSGVLGLNAQQVFSGPLSVNAGGVRLGVANAGSRFSSLALATNTRLDLAGFSTTLGSLSGGGVVFNSAAAATLSVGFDDSSTNFSGTLRRFNDAVPGAVALTKIGSGTLSFTNPQDAATGTSGLITVNRGTIAYNGIGSALPSTATLAGAFTVNTGGTLDLDNTATNIDNRLGLAATGTLNLQGGSLIIRGTNGSPTTETINQLNILNGGGTLTLLADGSSTISVNVTTLGNANSTGALLIRGLSATSSGTGIATLAITNPALQAGQGTGLNGTTTMPIRQDTIGDLSPTGLGTGFLVKDDSGFWRPLKSTELNTDPATWVAGENAGVSTAKTISTNSVVNSLTFGGSSTLGSALNQLALGLFGPDGLLTQRLSNGTAVLAVDGDNTINVGSLTGGGGITPYFHVLSGASLTVNGYVGIGGTAGLVKAAGGTLTLTRPAYYTGGNTTVDGGTLNLNSGQDNTLAVVPGATTPTVTPLNLHGVNSIVNLNNFSQAVGSLTSVNPLAGLGGMVTNSGASNVTLRTTGGGTFAGQITGNITFSRAGNNTTVLTNVNPYTGATLVRGGTLQLRDQGALPGTSSVGLQYGALNIDNSGLNPLATPNQVRLPATVPVTAQGGTLTLTGGGSTDNLATVNALTITGGGNTVNVLPLLNQGSTARLTIGNLVRNTASQSVVNFNATVGTTSTLGGQGLNTNGNIIINQINGATGPVNLAIANAVTTAGSSTVTVPSTAGLAVGLPVSGTGIPANEFITALNPDGIRFTITTGTGVTAQTATTVTANNLANNLIGGWAVANASTFATYVTGVGVSEMGQTTAGIVAPGFDGTDLSLATTAATHNINDGGSRTITATKTVNSLRLSGGAGQTIALGTFGTTTAASVPSTLTLGVGLISSPNNTIAINSADVNSSLTGAGADFYAYVSQSTTSINTRLSGGISLIKGGGGTLALNPAVSVLGTQTDPGTTVTVANTSNLTVGMLVTGTSIPAGTTIAAITPNTSVTLSAATTVSIGANAPLLVPLGLANTYTGNTIVQQGTLNLNGFATAQTIPGNLTLNNANVTMNANPGQIAATSNVTINGGGTITFANYATAATNSLNSISFNNQGGAANPTVALGTPTAASTLILSGANPITAVNDTFATTPVFTTGAVTLASLQLSNAAPVITTSGASPNQLNIQVPITAAGGVISKAGAGSLTLSAQNTFTTGLNLNEGSLIVGASSTPTVGTVTSGPVGTGTLRIAGGTSVLSDATRTLANPVTVAGDFAFGGVTAANSLILAGAVDLGAAGRTVNVPSPAVTGTFNEVVTSTATGTALTKTGPGTLVLGNGANSLNGAGVTVAGGLLRSGAANAIPVASPLTVSAGALFDLAGNAQTLQQVDVAGGITNSGAAAALVIGGLTDTDVTTNLNSTVAGVITNSANALSVTKSGLGTATFGGENAFSGPLLVNAGVVVAGNNTALGTTAGGTTVASGATLSVTGGVSIGAEALTISGTGAAGQAGVLVGDVGSNSFSGAISLAAASRIATTGSTSVLSLVGGITSTGVPLTIAGAGQVNVSGTGITGTGAGSDLVIDGGAKVVLSAASNLGGTVTVNNGQLELSTLSAGISGTTAVTVNASGSILFTGASANPLNNAPISLAGGSLAFSPAIGGGSETLGTLTMSAPVVIDFGGSVGNGNTFSFTSLNLAPGASLSVYNWSGSGYEGGSIDPNTDPTQDRLLFTLDPSANNFGAINFYSDSGMTPLGATVLVQFGGGFEIVPVPEPSSVALIATTTLLGLAGLRRRRR